MDYSEYKETLVLLKLDLGITHEVRDQYYNALLHASNQDLDRRGIHLQLTDVDDQMLLSDYAAYNYRHRTEPIQMSMNLKERIMNRKAKVRAAYGGTEVEGDSEA